VLAAPAVRGRLLHWGARPGDLTSHLPGDELLPDADLVATRVTSVTAPAQDTWQWVAQIGQGRGGFYSYDALENLVGCDIHSAGRIVPEWQHPEVGDEIRLHPEISLRVAEVDEGRALVLRGAVGGGTAPPPYDFTWAFVVQDAPGGNSRLLVRERYVYLRRSAVPLVEAVSVVSWFMSRRMLRGIAERAEGAVHGPLSPLAGGWVDRVPHAGWRLLGCLPPRIAYEVGLGGLVGHCVLALETTGRRSGRTRVTPLSYERIDGVVHVVSARGDRADWYLNLVAHPDVVMRIGTRRVAGRAEPITDPERCADLLERRLHAHPRRWGRLLRAFGAGREPSREDLVQYARSRALVAIHPTSPI